MRPGQSGMPGGSVPPGVGMPPDGNGVGRPDVDGEGAPDDDGLVPGDGDPLGPSDGDGDELPDGSGVGDGGLIGTDGVGSGHPSAAAAWSAVVPSRRSASHAGTVACPPGALPAERTASSTRAYAVPTERLASACSTLCVSSATSRIDSTSSPSSLRRARRCAGFTSCRTPSTSPVEARTWFSAAQNDEVSNALAGAQAAAATLSAADSVSAAMRRAGTDVTEKQ